MRNERRGSGPNPFGHGNRGHRAGNGTNGARPEGLHTRPVSLDDRRARAADRFDAHSDAEPVDLVAVQADDELITALSAGMAVSAPGLGGYDADDRVAAILAAWKADVDAEPMPELVDLDTAVSTVLAARAPSGRARHLAPLAAAAAFLVLAIGGLSVTSYSAQPDDVLWGMSKVLYSERAESVEAAARVETHIANAKQALVAGQPVLAAEELERAEADLAVVRPEEGQNELVEVQDFLVVKAQETPPGTPTDPGTPLASQPARPVPPGATVEPAPQPEPTQGPSGTTAPGSGAPADPRVASTPEPTTGPESTVAPTTAPGGGVGSGEGEPSQTSPGASPTATSEGAPSGGEGMGGAPGSTGATAAGSGTATPGSTS